ARFGLPDGEPRNECHNRRSSRSDDRQCIDGRNYVKGKRWMRLWLEEVEQDTTSHSSGNEDCSRLGFGVTDPVVHKVQRSPCLIWIRRTVRAPWLRFCRFRLVLRP